MGSCATLMSTSSMRPHAPRWHCTATPTPTDRAQPMPSCPSPCLPRAGFTELLRLLYILADRRIQRYFANLGDEELDSEPSHGAGFNSTGNIRLLSASARQPSAKNGQTDWKGSYSDGKWLEGCIALGSWCQIRNAETRGVAGTPETHWQKEGAGGQKTTGWGRTCVEETTTSRSSPDGAYCGGREDDFHRY
jgi:hypothetical protein